MIPEFRTYKMYMYDTYIGLSTEGVVQVPLIHEVQKILKLNAVIHRNTQK